MPGNISGRRNSQILFFLAFQSHDYNCHWGSSTEIQSEGHGTNRLRKSQLASREQE